MVVSTNSVTVSNEYLLDKTNLRFQVGVVVLFLVVTTVIARNAGMLDLVGWWIGVGLGWILLWADHLLDVFWIEPDTEIAVKARKELENRNWKGFLETMVYTQDQRNRLVMHSVIFEALVVVLAVYVATSGGNLFVRGLVLGLWGSILFDQAISYMRTNTLGRWLWQIRGSVPISAQGLIVVFGIIGWVLLTMMAI